MTVRRRGKGAHLTATVRMMGRRPRFGPPGRRPRLALDHDRDRAIDHAGSGQWIETEDRGRSQASASREPIRSPDLVPVQLGKRIHEVLEEVRLRMLPAVPDWVLAAISQPEVGGEIDN